MGYLYRVEVDNGSRKLWEGYQSRMEMVEMMGREEDGEVVEDGVRFVVDETERGHSFISCGYVTARPPFPSLSVSVICLLYCRLLSPSVFSPFFHTRLLPSQNPID